ncbi:cysteine-rich CWC family protein [Spirosoma sp. KNUC1025]|uniref:cysteine-rich CWC family protein n=1 Tax=Spirosoma sp. KNUC1025 TaxID=2894082 RepID=UPI00386C3741
MTSSACKHDESVCPRCAVVYECRVGRITSCQCMSVKLTEEQRQYVSSLFNGCLCANCLLTLQTEYMEIDRMLDAY